MRSDLTQEMLSVADILALRDSTSVEAFAGRLLKEAAEELDMAQKEKELNSRVSQIYISGNDVRNQISEINRERALKGMPPV